MVSLFAQQAITSVFREQFLSRLKTPSKTQFSILLKILLNNADTEFGRKYSFSKIKSVLDYQQAVPICSHEEIAYLIEKIKRGEQNILTQEPVNYFQLTSGTTTGQQRLIPSTRTYQREVWKVILASQGFLNQWLAKSDVQNGRGLMFIGTASMGITTGGASYSFVTANHARKSKPLWDWFSLAPFETTRIVNPDTRRYAIWRYALMCQNVAFVNSTYMVSLITCATTLFQQSEKLIHDVANGTLSRDLEIPDEQRYKLESSLKPDTNRARELEKIAKRDGGLSPKAIWHNLGWAFTVYGATFQNYESDLANWYGQKFTWGLPYLACEGLIGIPYIADSYFHIPAIGATFLEFIPEKYWQDSKPETRLITELEVGAMYEVVITGWNGFYRYRLGDIVQVGDMFSNVPTLKVISRRKSLISIVSEKTTEAQIVTAVKSLADNFGIKFSDFVVDIDQRIIPPRYQLWIETSISDINLSELGTFFDICISAANPTYGLLRNQCEISPPLIQLLPIGTFDRIRQEREKSGVPAEQIKILHAVNKWAH